MLAKKYVFFVSSNIFSVFLGYIAIFFISKFMGPVPLGIIGFAFSYVGLFAVLNDFGFFTAHVKMVSEGKDLPKCLGTILFLRICLAVLLALITIGSLFLWKNFVGGLENYRQEIAVYLILLSVILDGFSNILVFTFQAKHEIAKMQLPLLVSAIVRLVSIAITAVFSLGVVFLAACYIFGAISQLAMALLLSRGIKISMPDKKMLKEYLKFSAPLAIVGIFSAVYLNIDKLLIQYFYSSADVGLYYGSQKIGEIFNVLSAAIMALLIPAFSMYSVSSEKIKSNNLLFETERMMSLYLFPVLATILVFSGEILKILLSSKFVGATTIFFALSLAAFLNALNRPYSAKLVGTGNQKIYAKISLAVIFITVLLEVLLIPQSLFGLKLFGLGGFGAGISLVCGAIAAMLLLRFYCMKKLGTGFNKKPFFHFFAAILMSIAMIAVLGVFGKNPISIVFSVLLGLIVYFGFLALCSEFGQREIGFLIKNLNPKGIVKYIKGEI